MEAHFDEYEHYNFAYDKHLYSGQSGKGRTKREASLNTNRADPAGHNRKAVTKLTNNQQNKRKTSMS
jgi:nuclear protein 1